jgi:lipase
VEGLHVHPFGPADGRPVLALHGVTGHALRWQGLAPLLPGLRLLAVDLRGHGRSPWAPPWNLEQHVADVLAVLDAHDLARVPVIGHSFGGAIAVHLARASPERVEKLVLIDPALGLDPAAMLETATTTCEAESYADVAAARAERVQRWEGVGDEAVDAEIANHLVEEGGRWRYRYSTPAVVTAWSEMARPAVVPPPGLPTLLIPASKVDFVRPAWVERMRAELGESLTVKEMDTGHMVYLERPEEAAAVITGFV